MNNTDPNPAQIAAWMRRQSKRFQQMAIEIEETFGLAGSPNTPASGMMPGPPRYQSTKHMPDDLTPEFVRRVIGNRSIRTKTLAKELGVDQESLTQIITEQNGFEIGTRGWISVQQGAT